VTLSATRQSKPYASQKLLLANPKELAQEDVRKSAGMPTWACPRKQIGPTELAQPFPANQGNSESDDALQ